MRKPCTVSFFREYKTQIKHRTMRSKIYLDSQLQSHVLSKFKKQLTAISEIKDSATNTNTSLLCWSPPVPTEPGMID